MRDELVLAASVELLATAGFGGGGVGGPADTIATCDLAVSQGLVAG